MAQRTIEIGEISKNLTSHIQEVQDGATLVIMDHGKPVARLLPFTARQESAARNLAVTAPIEEKLKKLVASGVIAWSGNKPARDIPTFQVQGLKSVAEMLLEDRD
jgi:antitoxin (DNA-binding transcriptional repressor) of toxin-antitoxin stability system